MENKKEELLKVTDELIEKFGLDELNNQEVN